MKKLLLSAITALAFLFGFASCGLTDLETEKLYLAGDMNSYTNGGAATTDSGARNTFTKVNENTQTYKFIYHNDMAAWGGGNGKLNFKVCYDESSWKLDWGWKQDIPVSLVVNDTEWLELEHRDSANSNPGNIVVEDLLDGEEYTIEVDYDAPATSVKIKIYGNKPDFPSLRFVVVDKNGDTVKEIPLTRNGVTYSGEFASDSAGKYSGYLTNGYLYWGGNGSFATDETKLDFIEFDTEKDESGNVKVCNIKVKVDPANLSSITNIKLGDTSILAEAIVIGPRFGYDAAKIPLVFKDEENSELEFETFDDSGEVEFQILETSGTWWPRWYAGTDGKTDIVDAGVAKRTVAPTVEGTSVEPLYEEKELEYGKDKSIKFTGLPCVAGKKFVIKVKILDEDSKKLSISCEPAEGEKLTADDYTKVPPKEMSITVAGVPDSIKMTKDDAVYSYTLENDELAKIGESITISKITYDGKDYGIASGTTVEIDKAVSLIASGSAITLPIDKEQYKSYTFKVDTSDGLKLTVTGELSSIKAAYIVGDFTDGKFIEMTSLGGNFLAYTFEYKTVAGSWTDNAASIGFKVVAKNNWDSKVYIEKCEPDVNGEAKTTNSGNSSDKNTNAFVKNLIEGSKYTIIVDGKNSSEATVKIITGDEPLFIAGAFNSWTFELMERDNEGSYVTIATAGKYEFKVKKGCGWDDSPGGAGDTVFAGNEVTTSETETVENTTDAGVKNASVTTTKANSKLYVYKNNTDKYMAKLVEK
ncbi:MAG: hypothetical protein K2M50_07915 [Treponemataceae bacterium]|nr:hypothetical protein [Treponemataceae bacterium]